jgi:Major Facilitator Superfamily
VTLRRRAPPSATLLRRSARHPAPIVELPLLLVRSFAVANLAAFLLFGAGTAMLLASVELLSEVWGYSPVRTGLGLAPWPLTVLLLTTRVAGLGQRYGPRVVGAVGCSIFGLGIAYWAIQVGADRAYAADVLASLVMSGIGLGLGMPTLLTAGTASLSPQRAATGSAIITMSRQIAAVLGVAILIAILGTPASPAAAVDALRVGAVVMAAVASTAALVCLTFAPTRVTRLASVAGDEPTPLPDRVDDRFAAEGQRPAA